MCAKQLFLLLLLLLIHFHILFSIGLVTEKLSELASSNSRSYSVISLIVHDGTKVHLGATMYGLSISAVNLLSLDKQL
ncbi:transmembrane protein, putative [Medicago truncatula]|uniref:Transmembrane protein, putative n=1 Tax=Medicago truncatula TaxID=3880 RepID=A0A072U5X3_MEDTR|nr:transmembrane protein, putative [Medicago truncatula]